MADSWNIFRGELGEFIRVLSPSQGAKGTWYYGNVNAVYQNLEFIRKLNPKYILILGGGNVYKMNYGKVLSYHVDKQSDLTIVSLEVPLEVATNYGVIQTDGDNRIQHFTKDPCCTAAIPETPGYALVSMGIYVFNAKFLFEQLGKDAETPNSSHHFEKDIIPDAIKNNRVFSYPFHDFQTEFGAYWRDVDTLENYWVANIELCGINPDLNLNDEIWPIWTNFGAMHPPSVKFVFDDDERRGIAVDSIISPGCVISGATVRYSLMFPNTRINSYSTIQDSVILSGRNCKALPNYQGSDW